MLRVRDPPRPPRRGSTTPRSLTLSLTPSFLLSPAPSVVQCRSTVAAHFEANGCNIERTEESLLFAEPVQFLESLQVRHILYLPTLGLQPVTRYPQPKNREPQPAARNLQLLTHNPHLRPSPNR